MDQFLMIKKEEVISYLKVLKESYEKKARLYGIKEEIERKKKIKNEDTIMKYYHLKQNYSWGITRVKYVLNWYEFGVVPESHLLVKDAIWNSKDINEFILYVLEQRLLEDIYITNLERRKLAEKNRAKKR